MENQNKQVNENINKQTPEILRLECYRMVEDYVIPSRYDRKSEEVTDEQMDKIFAKAERLYKYIRQGTEYKEKSCDDEFEKFEVMSEFTRNTYYEWLDYNQVCCRKPIEVIKNKLTVPAGFVFEVKEVIAGEKYDKRLIHVVLVVSCTSSDGKRNDRYIHLYKTADELELDFYECPNCEPTMVIETKGDTPKIFSNGRKVYPNTFEIIK